LTKPSWRPSLSRRMDDLPATRMYALRHGQTGKIWSVSAGGRWLWSSPNEMKKSWNILKEVGLVSSEFEAHEVVIVELRSL